MTIPAIGITLSQSPNDSDGEGQEQAGKFTGENFRVFRTGAMASIFPSELNSSLTETRIASLKL
jgi:hypothetical protein